MELDAILAAIAQVGLPVGLIVWGVWFTTAKVWPWYSDPDRRELDRAIERGKSDALTALALSIERMADLLCEQQTFPGVNGRT
jgi:hypothetical protein